MDRKLKILLIDDSQADALLIERELKKQGINCEFNITSNQQEFLEQLNKNSPDLILSDFAMPQYNGMDALMDVIKFPVYIPFIIVTGSINEETAAECIKSGATDYVTKERLFRLGPSIKSALDKKETILLKEKAEQALLESEEKFRHAFEFANIGMCILSTGGEIIRTNNKLTEITGYERSQLLNINLSRIIFSDDRKKFEDSLDLMQSGNTQNQELEIRITKKNKQLSWCTISVSLVTSPHNTPLYFIIHISDINENKIALEKIRILSTSVEQTPITVIITDLTGKIEYVNPAFSDISGFSPEEVINKTPKILKSGVTKDEDYQNLWNTILRGDIWRGHFYNKKKNGEYYWESATISPIKNEKGKITHFVAIKEDISERKKMEEELIAAKEKAEESDRLKSVFLATMSHELRTPLNAIIGYSDLLTTEIMNSEQILQAAKSINESGKRLLSILIDLFDFSILQAEEIKLNMAVTPINKVMDDLFLIYGQHKKITSENIKLYTHKELSDQKGFFMTDEKRFKQIFNALLSNALKFTKSGEIEFGYKLNKDSMLTNKLTFFVKDTGIGIPENKRTLVFERFRQANEEYTRSFGGTGLGLAICKKLVDLMEGNIWIESKVDSGTTFFFELPGFISESKKLSNLLNKPSQPAILVPIKVLVIDDINSNLSLLVAMVAALNAQVSGFKNGLEGIAALRSEKDYNIALLDIQLPDISGYEVVKELKKIKPDIIVIAQTAYAMDGDKELILNSGFDDYLAKPINFQQLSEIILKYSNQITSTGKN